MKVRPYTEADAEKWDEAVGRSAAGTFLHTRRFLSYHGRRFEDLSIICEDEKDRVIGVFPAALKPDDHACVASHPGATYGGLLYGERSSVEEVEQMLAGIVRHYGTKGFKRLEYRSVPPHFHAPHSQADLYAIWKLGVEVVGRDLWSVVPLRNPPRFSNHHKREIARAQKGDAVVRVADSDASYRKFHAVLAACLAERHGLSPVHTPEEMLMLRDRFPQDIALWLAQDDSGRVLAGSWVFLFSGKAWHTQYIATSPEGRSRGAAYLVLDQVIREAMKSQIPCLSFGTSTEDNGRILNPGLFQFKSGFGAGAVCHDIYRLRLT